MKRKGATSKIQKLVDYKRYVDSETGEVVEIPVVSMQEKDCNFQKIWLGHILDAINSIGNQKIKILMWMIENRDSENRVFGSHRSIAEDTKCAKQTVSSVMASLVKHNAIKNIGVGIYQLNPDLIWKGAHGKRNRVLLDYGDNVKAEKKPKKPKKEAELS